MIFLAFILWCLYASFSGMRDAYIHSGYIHKVNEHNVWFAERMFAGLTMFAFMFIGLELTFNGLIHAIIILISLGLSFPFFQCGFYYHTYSKISTKKDYNFFSQSTTTDAKMNFDFPTRLSMFILAISLIILISFFI